ncbi:dihydrolipoamide acetyltransferase family protein [uncultured Bacteroides sp.]|uniref:dihydrolipoamide acetyltransferase family protein n=1 Tax=uncultured Bacteroides sp. TaxID=162156 RepID=UPI002AA89379|nr:dihydrolipoamide acetyltransferase family protein [uncultured Bacteroides sp.]
MSKFEVKMPKLGESITEGTIISWSVKVGDVIEEDQILFEVTTAKVNAEIPSPVEGKILEILFNEGDTVPVGVTVAIVQTDEDGAEEATESSDTEKTPQAEAPQAEAPKVAETAPATKSETSTQAAAPVSAKPAAQKEEEARWYSPIVLQLANQAQISAEELDSVQGTGYLGRLSKKDIQKYIEQKKSGATKPAAASQQSAATASAPKPASAAVAPTSPTEQGKASHATAAPVLSGEDRIIEMDPVRRIIADHMVMSKRTSPHVTSVIEVDVTKLVNWRKRVKDEFRKQEGVNLTYLPAITEAVARALIEYPQVNASVDGYKMIFKKHINVGIAVALDDGNLVVPVIHDADRLNTKGLAVSIDSLANLARANKLKVNDVQDGTFTITNFGTFKNIMGMPIINQPQVAILGVGFIEKKPAVIETPEGDVIAIRHKMYLSLSYDHRIIDGTLGGKFLYRIAEYLEQWDK